MKYAYFLFTFFIPFISFSQTNAAFEDQIVTWHGIDFSKAKLVGPEGFNDPFKIVDYYFNEWNELILRESSKYNLKKNYGKFQMDADLSGVRSRNSSVNTDGLVVKEKYQFGGPVLEEVVKDYAYENGGGVGFLWVVESLSKSEEIANIYVVFFDETNGNILWTRKFTGRPAGFGFRNYWAGAFYDLLYKSGYYFKNDAIEYKKQQRKLKRKMRKSK